MKNTLLGLALFLGFSGTGFSQTGTDQAQDRQEMFVKLQHSDGSTSDIVIENPNVSVVPGEIVIIHNEGTEKAIVVKGNGEYIGTIEMKERVYGAEDLGAISRARIKVVGTDNSSKFYDAGSSNIGIEK